MSKYNSTLTADRLRELLHYDAETGIFTRRVKTSNVTKVGDIAGTTNSRGYRKIRIDNVEEFAHHLAWMYVYGRFPVAGLDHINGDKTNNSIANLREATPLQNAQNIRRARADSQSGLLGAWFDKKSQTWCSQIRSNGKRYALGSFNTKEEAHNAYLFAKAKLHEFNTLDAPEITPQKRVKLGNKYPGVYFHKASRLWMAKTLKSKGPSRVVGYFKTDTEANAALSAACGN